MDWKKITHLIYWLFEAKGSGLNKVMPWHLPDFDISILGTSYQPKNLHLLKPIQIHDQKQLESCQWFATVGCKEIQENCKLGVQMVVAKGSKMKLCGYGGVSGVGAGGQVLSAWGALDEGIVPESDPAVGWPEYATPTVPGGKIVNPDDYANQAANHKGKGDFGVSNRWDMMSMIDQGIPVKIAIEWYTGFNQGGGFSSPWIIEKNVGLPVGGHCIYAFDYILNYYGRSVWKCANSYSAQWGDNGCFYIEMNYFDKYKLGAVVDYDAPIDLEQVLHSYNGKNIRVANLNPIYYLDNGVKRQYPDVKTLSKYKYPTYNIPADIMAQIPSGSSMV